MILAIKTDGSTASLWLYKDIRASEAAATLEWESGRALSDELLGHIADLVAKTGAELHDLKGVVIFSGPGSFTSLRIGHATANALADSLGVPIAGARGEKWLSEAMSQLDQAKAGHPVLPHYGGEAHITRPRSKT